MRGLVATSLVALLLAACGLAGAAGVCAPAAGAAAPSAGSTGPVVVLGVPDLRWQDVDPEREALRVNLTVRQVDRAWYLDAPKMGAGRRLVDYDRRLDDILAA